MTNKYRIINIREIAELSVIAAVLYGSKELMNVLPNIHITFVLMIITAVFYGWKAIYPVLVFVFLEIASFGFGLWSIMYLYIWPLGLCLIMLFRKNRSSVIWAIIAAFYGFAFGALCSIPVLFTSGFKAAAAYWISGIPFDLIHCVSNGVLTFILYKPLFMLMQKIKTAPK